MASSILGLSNFYYNSLVSPVKSYETNPTANLIYGAAASKIYSQTFAKKLQSSVSTYLSTMNSGINNLKNSAKALASSGPSSGFDQKAVVSDNSSITGTVASNADLKTYVLNISKLASGQVNTGVKLDSNSKTSFSTGVNTFSIQSEGKSKYVSFSVNENDTNKTSLDNMAKAINNSKIGISASVITDSKAGTSYLKLSSTQTGTRSSFNVSDLSGSSVSFSGAGSMTTAAQDAEYTVDGTKYTSQENDIKLNNGKIDLTLTKAENKDIKLAIEPDKGSIKSDIKGLVESYNNTINFSNSFSSSFDGAKKLGNELSGIVKSRKSSLEHIGITINADNTLSIDNEKLDKSLNNNLQGVKSLFHDSNGIAQHLYDKSKKVLNSPIEYSKPSDFNSFYNLQSSNQITYKQNLYRGLVVDTLL